MSSDQFAVDVEGILVICAYDNRATGSWNIAGQHDVLTERAASDRFAASGTANRLVRPDPL